MGSSIYAQASAERGESRAFTCCKTIPQSQFLEPPTIFSSSGSQMISWLTWCELSHLPQQVQGVPPEELAVSGLSIHRIFAGDVTRMFVRPHFGSPRQAGPFRKPREESEPGVWVAPRRSAQFRPPNKLLGWKTHPFWRNNGPAMFWKGRPPSPGDVLRQESFSPWRQPPPCRG